MPRTAAGPTRYARPFAPLRWSLSLLLGTVVLVSCASFMPGPLTVEAAVAQETAQRPDGMGALVDGPEVRLVQETLAGTAAVYTMETEHEATRMHHTNVSFFRQEGLIWRSTSGSGAGGSGPREAVEFIPAEAEGQFFMAYGVVSDATVTSVRVPFANQLAHTVPVENGAYLAVVGAVGPATKLEALDAQGTVIHTIGN